MDRPAKNGGDKGRSLHNWKRRVRAEDHPDDTKQMENNRNWQRAIPRRTRTGDIWKRIIICMVICGLLITSVKGAVQGARPPLDSPPGSVQKVEFRSRQQHLRKLMNSGLPNSRAITRLVSDTPNSIERQSQQGGRRDGIIQREMIRLREQGVGYGKAATLSVESDRMPTCQVKSHQAVTVEENESATQKEREELKIWSLNVRGISSEARLKELEQEAEGCKSGVLLVQETWRRDTAERINIGNWIFYGTGNAEKPRGNGTGVLIHKSIPIESWHYISSRLTAVRIQYGDKHIMLMSAYAPVQPGGVCSARTVQFYEQLTAKEKEAKAKGDIVIIRGRHECFDQGGERPRPDRQVGQQQSRRGLGRPDQLYAGTPDGGA